MELKAGDKIELCIAARRLCAFHSFSIACLSPNAATETMNGKSCNPDGFRKKKLAKTESLSKFTQYIKRTFRDYCENTGLHGFRFIVTSETAFDRTIWFLVCLASIVFCVMLMLRFWQYFSNNPTVTIINTANPIRELQFPGITICNNNKVYKPHAERIAKKLLMNGFDRGMTNKLFSSLMKLIRPDKIEIDNATATWALDILGYSVEKLMLELMQPCNLLLLRCSWLGQLYDCNKIFKIVKSNEGFCCGFNYHFDLSNDYNNEHSWLMNITLATEELLELNSSESLPGVGKILHVPGTGRDIGLSVALDVDAKNYKSSVLQFVGASILVHDSLDYPDVGAQSSTLQPGHVMSMTLSGTKIKSSRDIQNIPLGKRRCLFDGEVAGERRYSYQTCISECIQQKTYGSCGCLPFFFPDEHPTERTCYLTDVDCVLSRRRTSQSQLSHVDDCNCLPQCNDKTYEVFSETVPIGDVEYDSEITRGLDVKRTSFLYVYFRDATYLEYQRQTILGWDSLLASFGGIFGLCLGGSVISFVEFLYYLIVDFFPVRKKKNEKQDQDLKPASKLFLSVPVNAELKKYNTSNLNKRVFLEWDRQLSQRNRKNPDIFKRDAYRE